MATAPRQTVGDLGVEILAEGGLGVIVEPQILEEEPPSVKGGIVQTGVRVPGPTLTGVPLIKPFRVEDVEARYRELAAKEPQTLWGQVLKEM